MGAAAAVFDGAEPPPELKAAWTLQRWGATNVLEMPAGLVRRMGAAQNVYNACNGYASSKGHSVDWVNQNPAAWNLVSALIAERRHNVTK